MRLLASLVLVLLLACGSWAGAMVTDEPAPRTAIKAIVESGVQEWTLLVLGDSLLGGFPASYAAVLEDELHIPVKVQTHLVETASEMQRALRGNPELRKALSQANVVFFTIPRRWFAGFAPDASEIGQGAATKLQVSLPRALDAYKKDVVEIVSEIVALRSPFEAIIRTMDLYAPWDVSVSQTAGVQPMLHKYWSAANEYLLEIASAYRVPVARVYATFNGLSGNEDPLAKGYLARPGMLCTDRGVRQLVRLVDELELGYGLYKID